MGGLGWTEHCPKCSKARLYGWKESVNTQHSAQRRRRIDAELATTENGRARLEHSKLRHDRYAAKMGEQIMQDMQTEPPVQPDGGDDSTPHFAKEILEFV